MESSEKHDAMSGDHGSDWLEDEGRFQGHRLVNLRASIILTVDRTQHGSGMKATAMFQ